MATTGTQRVWDDATDVIVVGGGATGFVAAITALDAEARVLICEKAGVVGGTSARSGGAYFIPNNFDMRARGVVDLKADFLRYAARYSYPTEYDPAHATLGIPEPTYRLIEAFYENADEMVAFLARVGALQSTPYASHTEGGIYYYYDYLEHVPENKAPQGRILAPKRLDGSIGAGDELMAQLIAHARRAGARILVDSPVIDIAQSAAGEVEGVVVRVDGVERAIRAQRGVIFCSGGYAHNPELIRTYQADPILGRCTIPTSTGDFVQLGVRAGARLGNMTGAWRAQCVLEEALRDQSLSIEVFFSFGDSMFMVNKYGRRALNENRNYHDKTRASYQWDANRAEYPNLLMFPVYDRRTAERYAGTYPIPDQPLGRPYVISGDTLEALASALDSRLATLAGHTGRVRLDDSFLPALKDTFSRFNRYAREGRDPDFERGRYPSDPEVQIEHSPANPYPNGAMHPLSDTGPYYSMILAPAILDTNGGPVIDPTGAVLDTTGRPIPGLYGAGNCIASPVANAYWGSGATIGTGMTFAYLAGRSAAARKPS